MSGSGSGSGSESDASSLAAVAAAHAKQQASTMAAAAIPPGPASAPSLYGNPQSYAAVNASVIGNHVAGVAAPNMLAGSGVTGITGLSSIAAPNHPIAEFLYQLTKMLTDDNSSTIQWKDGRIYVHDPQRLADEVLAKYFRHSKYASFQRQLNYFGFKKIAGKGKMSPCSYVNDAATDDIRSLLFIKRKTAGLKADAKKAGAGVAAGEGRKRKVPPATSTSAIPGKRQMNQMSQIGQMSAAMNPALMNALAASDLSFLQQAGNAAQHPYAAILAQQQALLAAQSVASSASTATPAPGTERGVTGALTSTETIVFPNETMLNSLITAGQQQQYVQQQIQQQQQKLQQKQPQQQQFQFQEQQLQLQLLQQQLQLQQAQQKQQHQQQAEQQAEQQAMPCPATMAMKAASAPNGLASGSSSGAVGGNAFGSSANLTSLLETDTNAEPGSTVANPTSTQTSSQVGVGGPSSLSGVTSSAFLSSLPSANTLFPDNMSSLSLNRLLNSTSRASITAGTPGPGGAGRVPSMLGLSGFLSRENSLLDLAMGLPTRPSVQALQALGMYVEPNQLPDGDVPAQILG